ncbi:MAG: hypothetical protein LBQ21_07480 [Clostridiales Family XIII bacterium]|jgi:hypothetical protein|nr:hypothetical protein [Clostridiales Family XIII bacterium]
MATIFIDPITGVNVTLPNSAAEKFAAAGYKKVKDVAAPKEVPKAEESPKAKPAAGKKE